VPTELHSNDYRTRVRSLEGKTDFSFYLWLLNDALSGPTQGPSNSRIISEYRMGKYVEWSGRGLLFYVLSRHSKGLRKTTKVASQYSRCSCRALPEDDNPVRNVANCTAMRREADCRGVSSLILFVKAWDIQCGPCGLQSYWSTASPATLVLAATKCYRWSSPLLPPRHEEEWESGGIDTHALTAALPATRQRGGPQRRYEYSLLLSGIKLPSSNHSPVTLQ
jgi:hypothetical protein